MLLKIHSSSPFYEQPHTAAIFANGICTKEMKIMSEMLVKCPWAGLSGPAAALLGGAAIQRCWFLYIFKHARLVSQLEFPADFFQMICI